MHKYYKMNYDILNETAARLLQQVCYNERPLETTVEEDKLYENADILPFTHSDGKLEPDDSEIVNTHVRIASEQIIDAYTENKHGRIDSTQLQYITDKDLLAAIVRKANQMHVMLKSCYNQDIPVEILEQSIRRYLKYVATAKG